jgi:outer membrane protein OmpA-like peptidoglycan-associated protein
MQHLFRQLSASFAMAMLGSLCATGAARADDGFVLAVSSAHKLKVLADGGAKWCGPHLKLRMVLDADSPDAGNAAAQVELMNRLKAPIGAECAAATDGEVAVFVQSKPQGSYKATKAGGWIFTAPAVAAVRQPASLDAPGDKPQAAVAQAALPAASPAPAAAPAPARTMPGDVAGARDPDFLKRYADSKIIAYTSRSYDQYTILVDADLKKRTVEGALTRLLYRVGPGHTCLELYRNYQQALKELGFTITGEQLPCKAEYGRFGTESFVWSQTPMPIKVDGGNPYTFNCPTSCDADGPQAYFSAQGTLNGQDISVGVIVVEKHVANRYTPAGGAPTKFDEGDIAVGVDIVTAKAVDINMVTVRASDIADALASTGTIALYGILFDVDKTDIKAESGKTLDEIASVLKIDRALKLEISGHTDNTGGVEHNQKLSEGRAQAVVDALVKKYGIDAGRLQAKGYGDTKPVADNATDAGKAKNRRVELHKI